MSVAIGASQPDGNGKSPLPDLGRSLVWLLYTNNPFYLLSACFVFHGVALWFQAGGGPHKPWSLTVLVAGYILMLGAAGFGIVRWGRVWDDARSILLVIVLLFPVLALTLDDTMLNNLGSARLLSVGGFIFSLAVSEGLLLGLRIRLHWLFRVPYYGMLGLLFLYPLALLPAATDSDPTKIAWRIFLFPSLTAAVFLSLLPAVRRGSELVRNNGTPWQWPRFPWAILVTLGICVCFRAYSLSLSFDPVLPLGSAEAMQLQSAFGIYFFVPVMFSIAVLLLEFGIVSGKKSLLRIAIALPALCLAMSVPNAVGNAAYANFLELFSTRFGSPVYLTIWTSCLFYAYGWLRKVSYAEAGLVSALLLLSVSGPGTQDMETLVAPQIMPLMILGVLELAFAIRTRDSRRFTVAVLACAAVLQLADATSWLVTGHMAIGGLLVVSVLCRDEFAQLLRQLVAVALAAACVEALFFPPEIIVTAPSGVVPLYVAVLIGLATALAIRLRSLAFCSAALAGTTAVTVDVSWQVFLYLRDFPGIASFLPAVVLFGVAVAISILKTGPGRRMLRRVGVARSSA